MELLFLESEMDMPAKMVRLPLRCTVVPLAAGGSVIISPVAFSASQLASIRSLGPVQAIVAPNLLHHLHVAAAAAAREFPLAKLWGPRGIREKVPDVRWDFILDADAWPYENELATQPIRGLPKINETVFLHKSTRTLIVTDFCFNLVHPQGWAAGLMLRVLGVYGKFAVSKLQLRFLQDRAAMRESVRKIEALSFDRLVMAHGDILETRAKPQLDSALLARLGSF